MKLQLNFNKPGNYAFFCPLSKIHLTRSNPVAFVNEVTPYINRGLKSKAIIEIVETEGQKANIKKEEEPVKKEEVASSTEEATKTVEEVKATEKTEETKEEPKTEEVAAKESAPAEEKPKRGRRSSSN